MVVSELMTCEPAFADVAQPARKAAETMHDLDVRHLPVVDGQELVGILSDRDVHRFTFGGGDLEQSTVADIMSADVLSLSPEDSASDVVDLMVEHKVGAVPVVDASGALVGIVSYVDVLGALRERLAD
jgi:acetoin utilization protein AcuB